MCCEPVKEIGGIYRHGPWGVPYKAKAMCSDGKLRMCSTVGEPDTYFSQPVSMPYKGTRIAGFVAWDMDYSSNTRVLKFHPYRYRKNPDLLPPWENVPQDGWFVKTVLETWDEAMEG